jgi:hypothetical protein
MRALLVLLLLSSVAYAVPADPASWKWGERFSHAAHAARLAAKGKAESPCASCHQLRGADFAPIPPGKNNHHPCIDCHGPSEFSRGPKCLTCHSSIRGFKPGRPWFPPYVQPGEFHVGFPHAKHVGGAGQAAETCGGCHAKQEGRGGAGASGKSHGACGICHASDVKPAMSDCAGCHQPGPAPPAAHPAEEPSIYRTTQKFDHAAHARKVAQRGLKPACNACHLGLSAQDPPARPTMQMCEGCHDGRTAFDARGNHCGSCHSTPPDAKLSPLPAPQKQFHHEAHQALNVKISDCASCHAPGLDWKAVHAGRNNHQPCQQCHAAEFRMPGQPICLTCHERNDPFTPNPLRPTPKDEATRTRDWRVGQVPHPPHLAARVACATCHPKEANAAPTVLGHALCGQCHKEGAKTTLAMCGACHVSASQKLAARADRPWSTRARFVHDDKHRQGCDSCHRTAGAPDLTPPTMKGCATCHEGAKAFKVTGFECAKCHGSRK